MSIWRINQPTNGAGRTCLPLEGQAGGAVRFGKKPLCWVYATHYAVGHVLREREPDLERVAQNPASGTEGIPE